MPVVVNYAATRRSSTTVATLALAAAIAVGVALRVLSIWAPRLWGDELFNYSLSQGTWLTLLKRAALDMAHPPLFYLLLKPWIYVVGGSMAGLRVFTVALSVAAFAPFIALGRALRLRTRETALACAMMAVNSYLIIYSYYLRPYSLLLLLTLCSHTCFVRFLRRGEAGDRRAIVLLTAVNVLLVYTHYFGWLAFAAQYLWVAFADRSRLRRMTLVVAVVLLGFLPWVGVIAYTSTQASYTFVDQISWYVRPDAHIVLLLLRSFNGGFESAWLTLAGSGVFVFLVVLGLRYSARALPLATPRGDGTESRPLALLAWLTLFPVALSLAAAWALTWIWAPRYVIVSTGPYLLLAAACAFRLPSKYARAAAATFLLAWSSAAGLAGGDLAEALHGPNGPSYWLALSLSRAETRSQGPIPIFGLSPYAEQGLRLALGLTGEHRFKTVPCGADCPLPDGYFWIALTEHDPHAARRVSEMASDPSYVLGEPIYGGAAPQRHILIPVQRRTSFER